MRSGGEGIGALRDHPRDRHFVVDLLAGQVAADARLGSLTDLDLDGRARLEVIGVNAESPGGALHDDVILVGLEVGVEASFARVHEGAESLGSHRQRRPK